MKELDELYKLLKEKDAIIADTYKEGVFDHIERIRIKVGIGELQKIPDKDDKPKTDNRNVDLIKSAIKNLVDYLS